MKIVKFHISNTEGRLHETHWNYDVCLANLRSFWLTEFRLL